MTTEKLSAMIGQMLMFGFPGARGEELKGILDDIKKYKPGGVWLTDNNSPLGETRGNITSPQQLSALCRHLQEASEVPLFIAIDAEGGQVIRLREHAGFPATVSARYLGRRDDPRLTFRHYEAIARNLRALGVNFNLAPVVDLDLRPDNPALGGKERCFSPEAEKVIAHARAAIAAHESHNILTCLKHYPGHGSAGGDSHLGMVDITESWSGEELKPYQALIGEGYDQAVLVAHVIHRGTDERHPATLSSAHVRDGLRKRLGFTGLILSDDLNMGAIKKYYSHREMLALAINAGVDVLVHSNLNPYEGDLMGRTVEDILALVDEGRVKEARVEQAFNRIITRKKALLSWPSGE